MKRNKKVLYTLRAFWYLTFFTSFLWFYYWTYWDVIVLKKSLTMVPIQNYIGVILSLIFILRAPKEVEPKEKMGSFVSTQLEEAAKPYFRGHLLPKLVSQLLVVLGSITLVWVGGLTFYDMTVWGKDISLIFFGSRTGENISLGIGVKVIHYFILGLALLLSGLIMRARAVKRDSEEIKTGKMKIPKQFKITRMARIPKKTRQITAAVSVAIAIGFTLLLLLLWSEQVILFSNELFLGALLAVLVPSAILDYVNQSWVEAIENEMPLLVRGISEIQETGLTFVKAFDKVVENRMVHAPLSEEVERLTVEMSWGLSFEEALRRFRDRIGSPGVNRFCALILEASHSGGQIRKVFTATSSFMQEMKEIDRETSSQMKPYLLIIYTAFFVFVVTAIILLSSFFVPLEDYTDIIGTVGNLGAEEFRGYFYRTMLVSGLLGGLMAGKMGELRVAGGLKHAIGLMVVGYLIFYLLIPPNWMVM